MALVPIGTDQKFSRLPWVTAGLIAINVLVWQRMSGFG